VEMVNVEREVIGKMTEILPTLATTLIILFLMAIFVANFAWHLRKD
jgi:p-aminobenzoyl-glutamate transporter AbgT